MQSFGQSRAEEEAQRCPLPTESCDETSELSWVWHFHCYTRKEGRGLDKHCQQAVAKGRKVVINYILCANGRGQIHPVLHCCEERYWP